MFFWTYSIPNNNHDHKSIIFYQQPSPMLPALCWALLWAFPTLALQLSRPPITTTTTRRAWLVNGSAAVTVVVLPSSTAAFAEIADDTMSLVDGDAKAAAKEAVRVESTKGIAYMRAQLEAKDYDSLLEFTKTYDLKLRKGYMGRAKKLMSGSSDVLTSLANAVTFDLIGINRNVRKGQVNPEQAAKYIQELQDDVNKFLALD
jgi:hypothetical protein